MLLPEHRSGDPLGSHRVIGPAGALPQAAARLNSDMQAIWDNEILLDVDLLNIDSSSMRQIAERAAGDPEAMCQRILDIVATRGKMHNPDTGSGGVLTGTVRQIGSGLSQTTPRPGDRIVSLVSLSLTPLEIDRITAIDPAIDRVAIDGRAVLFASSSWTRIPDDLPTTVALAVLDVCGAPAQTARLVEQDDMVLVLGAAGKSGTLSAHEAKRLAGPDGRVIGLVRDDAERDRLSHLELCTDILVADARDALAVHRAIVDRTDGRLADVVINCVNVANTEMGAILACRTGGTIYFFSMATSFARAALGAEGVGKDVRMMIGNGYVPGHAELALDILRDCAAIRRQFTDLYAENATAPTSREGRNCDEMHGEAS